MIIALSTKQITIAILLFISFITMRPASAFNKILLKRILLCFLAASLTSCELLEPGLFKKQPLNKTVKRDKLTKTPPPADSQAGASLTEDKVEIYQGSGAFVEKHKSQAQSTRQGRNGQYVLNFENADLIEVVRVVLDETLKRNYTIDPKVTGKVSLRTTKPLTEAELLSTLEMILQMNNAVLSRLNKGYQIQPALSALSSGVSSNVKGMPMSAGFQLRIIPLLFVSAKQMQEILKPLIPTTATIQIDTNRNLLMVAGNAEQLENIEQTVNIFDVDSMQGLSFGLFPLNSVDPETVNKELGEIFGYSSGGPMEDMFKIVPIERLNAILVITPQAQYLEQIKQWLARLDRSKLGAKGGVHVYRAQHLKAIDLATTLNDIFGQTTNSTRKVNKTSLASGKKPVQASNKSDKSESGNSSASSATMGLDSSLGGANSSNNSSGILGSGSNALGSTRGQSRGLGGIAGLGEIRLIADEVNNTLVIVANAKDYKTVYDLLIQLDVMPLQVHIDASILSVNLTDDIKYGVEWKFNSAAGGKTGIGMLGDLALDAAFPGFSYIISKGEDVKAILHALAENKEITVVSSPSLMVLNNQEAKIQVGDQVPIRTSQSTNTSGSVDPIQTSSIEMRDTGVTLKVTPRVNSSGVVIMDIEQSVDTPSSTSTSNIDSPTILKRSINSSVAIDGGETVILGGLISDNIENDVTGVPFLKDIPGLGALFSTTNRNKKRNELIVLITPEVVYNKSDAREVTREYKSRLGNIFEDLSSLKKNKVKTK